MMIIVENYKGYSHTLPTMHIRQGDSSIIAWIALPPFHCSCLRKKAKVLRREELNVKLGLGSSNHRTQKSNMGNERFIADVYERVENMHLDLYHKHTA